MSTGVRLLRLGELAVLWKVGKSPNVIARLWWAIVSLLLNAIRSEVSSPNTPQSSFREACERKRRDVHIGLALAQASHGRCLPRSVLDLRLA